MKPPNSLLAFLVSLSIPAVGQASGPEFVGAEPAGPLEVFGGEATVTCGWPTTVSMQGMCTGTLVHPQVVIYAQHCGDGYSAVLFGESDGAPARSVPTEFCRTFPNGGPGTGQDFAFCKLAEPVLDVPIVPPLMGCDVDKYLQPGQMVTIVGFGFDEQNNIGVKREVEAPINNFENNEAFIGGNGKDSCNGDSGGPVFVKIDDGTWRVFGITSYGGQCGTGGWYSMMHNGMSWFEQESGIDLTPCTTADGIWMPDPARCKGFPTDPGAGTGDWGSGCAGGPVGGQSATCGPPSCMDDVDPPTATITAPADETVVFAPDMTSNVVVPVTVDAADVGCSGLQEVRLLINGSEIPMGVDTVPPFEFNTVSWPTGCFEVGAKAVDFLGNEGLAEPHTLCVNMEVPPPPPPPDTDSDGSGGTGGTGDSGGGTGDPTEGGGGTGGGASAGSGASAGATAGETDGDGDKDGCGCRSGQGAGGSLGLLVGLGLLAGRRRRR